MRKLGTTFTDQISELKIEAPDKTQSNRGVSKTSEEVRRRQDEHSEELRNGGSENDRRTDEEPMKNRRGYGRRYCDKKSQGQFEARINYGPSEELKKARMEREKRRNLEAENNRGENQKKIEL